MSDQFDLIVIGTGAGASSVATTCRRAGWSVAVVDSRPYGGTCALRGCDPKKVLVGAADAVHAARRLRGKGVHGDVRIDWPELMRFKRTFTDPVPAARERGLAQAGIATFHGDARFVGATSVQVGGRRLQARYIHVATGAKPAPLPISGSDDLTLSDRFLELDELPERIVFVGSGYISFEFAHLACTAGARVTMLEMLDRPLAGFDPDLVALLVERSRSMGIDIRLGTRVESIEKRGSAFKVRARSRGEAIDLDADLVVHGAGRVPDIDQLALEVAGVEHDGHGIAVNEYMQSVSNIAVYAAGDAAKGGLPLTPVASLEGRIAAANLVDGNRRKILYPPIPSVVFTLPPLAMVGMREDEALSAGLEFEIHHARTSGWYSSRRVGEELSGYKVLIEKETGRIVGAHLFSPHAEEVINLFAMAMRCGMTSQDIKELLFAYPTLASDVAYMV